MAIIAVLGAVSSGALFLSLENGKIKPSVFWALFIGLLAIVACRMG